MKKLMIITAMNLALALPMSAMADDDVTIRVMEVHEDSSDAVMQQIELPDAASDQANERVQAKKQVREQATEGEQEMVHEGEMEQLREMERERESIMEEQHEHSQQTEQFEASGGATEAGPQSGMNGRN